MNNQQNLPKKPNHLIIFFQELPNHLFINPAKVIGRFLSNIYKGFIKGSKNLWNSFTKGDIWVKLSALVLGIGSFRRKQFVKGFLLTVFQALYILFMIFVGFQNITKLYNLGSVEYAVVYDPITRKNIVNNYDHSFLILLFSLLTIVFSIVFIVAWIRNLNYQYAMQIKENNSEHIDTFKEDMKSLLNDKFHKTLLALPVSGVVIFTIIPLIFMFLIAFTNYDENHQPPIKLFTWVGLDNFQRLFSFGSSTSQFSYSFGVIIVWTLIWAFFATVLNYLGGMILALWINNKTIKWKKMWRTIFILTIAIPQFVSLLLVKNFFANQGIANQIAIQLGILDFLKSAGLVRTQLSYIPFLSDPMWTRVMLILINCWIGFPYVMLITTGVLLNIPQDLYESARIDGANKLQLFGKITLPYMLFVTAPYLITNFIHNMNNFNVIYLLTFDRPTNDLQLAFVDARDVDLLVTWLFRLTAEQSNFKMASTVGVILFLISVVFTLLAFNQTIKANREETFQ